MNSRHAGLPHPDTSPHILHSGFGDVGNDGYGTLIFAADGRICGGGPAYVDQRLGVTAEAFARINASWPTIYWKRRGRRFSVRIISDFIAGFFGVNNSPVNHPRSAAALCEMDDWQQFEALDVLGRSFDIGIRLSRRMTNGEEVFVLNFHRPGQALFPPAVAS